MSNEQTFIDETFRGEAQGGFYFRNVDMKHHFEKVKNNGKKGSRNNRYRRRKRD